MADNDLIIRVRLAIDDLKAGKQLTIEQINDLQRSIDSSNRQSAASFENLGRNFEQSFIRRLFSARTAVGQLFRAIGLGAGIWGLAIAGVTFFINRIKEAQKEAEALLQVSGKVSQQRILHGEKVFIPTQAILEQAKEVAKGTEFEKQPGLIARVFSQAGINLTKENIQAISGIAAATEQEPKDIAKLLATGEQKDLAEMLNITPLSKEASEEEQEQFRKRLVDIALSRGIALSKRQALERKRISLLPSIIREFKEAAYYGPFIQESEREELRLKREKEMAEYETEQADVFKQERELERQGVDINKEMAGRNYYFVELKRIEKHNKMLEKSEKEEDKKQTKLLQEWVNISKSGTVNSYNSKEALIK